MRKANKRLVTTLIGIKRDGKATKQAREDIRNDDDYPYVLDKESAIREFNMVSRMTEENQLVIIKQGKEYIMRL